MPVYLLRLLFPFALFADLTISEANRLYGQTNDGAHLHPFLNHIILGLAKALFRLSRSVSVSQSSLYRFTSSSSSSLPITTGDRHDLADNQVASLSPHPPRDPRSPRSIRDITRQIIEKSMQVSSASYGENDADPGVEMVGDAAWGLANILWRIYAEVRRLFLQFTLTHTCLSPKCDTGGRIANTAAQITHSVH